MVEEAHLLVEETVDNVGSGILPLDQPDQSPVQRHTKVHRPVIGVQGHLERERDRSTLKLRSTHLT